MSKKCLKCGWEAADDAKFCIRCGSADFAPPSPTEKDAGENASESAREEKVRAEWHGADYRYDRDKEKNVSRPSAEKETPARKKDVRRGKTDGERAAAARKRRKPLFALAFAGLLLDFLCGIGFPVCLGTAIVATADTRRLYVAERKTSTQLIWAMTVGYLGAVGGLVFFLLVL